jgi:hydrogenase maturation factor
VIIACESGDAERLTSELARAGEPNAVRIGRVVSGQKNVQYRR